MIFDLPEMLIVERAGRAMALGVKSSVEIGVSSSAAGAAALAAARRIGNRGLKLKVILTDNYDNAIEAFIMNLNVVQKMKLLMTFEHEEGEFPCVISGTDTSATFGSENFVVAKFFIDPKNKSLWDGWNYDRNPYLKLGKKSSAITVEQARRIDKEAVEIFGLETICLMENAGIGAAVVADQMCATSKSLGDVVVLAGTGNNGGDAYVVARGLLEKGLPVKVVPMGLPVTADAKSNYDILQQQPQVFYNEDEEDLFATIATANIIVDGLFGTGLSRNIEGKYREVIEAANLSEARVLALDIPSGIDGDTGKILGCAIKADVTVSFEAAKVGMFEEEAKDCCGKVLVADIGTPVLNRASL